jgi:hypothetical protein
MVTELHIFLGELMLQFRGRSTPETRFGSTSPDRDRGEVSPGRLHLDEVMPAMWRRDILLPGESRICAAACLVRPALLPTESVDTADRRFRQTATREQVAR